jgi:hypothetical protein
MSRKTRVQFGGALLVVGLLLFVREFGARSDQVLTTIGVEVPFLVSDGSIIRNLNTSDRGLLIDSVSLLAYRNNPAATDKAREMMHGDDTWVHGALYLGHFGDQTAIPYLIKALHYTYDARLAPLVTLELTDLTGQNFPANFKPWHEWWEKNHPGDNFDFNSLLDRHALGLEPATNPAN